MIILFCDFPNQCLAHFLIALPNFSYWICRSSYISGTDLFTSHMCCKYLLICDWPFHSSDGKKPLNFNVALFIALPLWFMLTCLA